MKQISAIFLVLISLLASASGQKKTANSVMPVSATVSSSPQFFPVSVWYSGGKARAPMLETVTPDSPQRWREDLVKIKQLGFNTVRTWVEWTAGEPREGEYHFENLELLLRLAEEQGLRVIVQVYVDSAPDWVGKKYPDGHYVAQSGAVIKSQAAPGYCFDHPEVRRAILNFFQEAARRASKSKAFYAWDLWSEPAVMNWAQIAYVPNANFCYCPHSIARFREWLKAKYGTVDALNKAWYRSFGNWSEVEPPRFGTILSYTDFVDWRVYIGDKIAQDLKYRNDAIKAVDTAHVTTSHAPNPSPVFRTLADTVDSSDDYLMKGSVDYFGTSFYPKLTSPDRNFPLERRALVMDMVRAVTGDKGFYVGELQAGYGVHGVIAGTPITANDLELYTWGMVSRGAKAVNYYAFYPMSTGYESGGYGMIQLDGTLTERSHRAGQTAKKIADNTDFILSAKPQQAEAAVIFNPLTPLLGGEQNYGDRRSIHKAVAGYHRMFFERNIPVDFPSAREITAESLRKYKLVVVPYPLLMTKQMANVLEQYVREGGHLFTEARPGWVDELGHAQQILPGFGWHNVFGVRENEVLPGKQFTVKWAGSQFTTLSFQERFDIIDPQTKVVATFDDGTPAAYEHKFGKGSAIILGSFAGEANQNEPVAAHPLGAILTQWAGISAPQLKSSSFVELRTMSAPNGELILVFNHDNKPADVDFSTTLSRPIKAARELVAGQSIAADGSKFNLKTQVPADSVRVYRLDY